MRILSSGKKKIIKRLTLELVFAVKVPNGDKLANEEQNEMEAVMMPGFALGRMHVQSRRDGYVIERQRLQRD